MLAWIRRDEALRGWLLWMILGAASTSALTGMTLLQAASQRTPVSGAALLLTAWAAAAVYLLFGRVRWRCGGFHLTLPLSARTLWLVHVAAAAIVGSSIALLAVLVELAHLKPLGPRIALDYEPVSLVLHLVVGMVLAVVLLQVPVPRLARIPVSPGNVAWTLGVLAAVPSLLVLLLPRGPVWALLPLGLAAAIAGWVRPRLPLGFTLFPLEPKRTRRAAAVRLADAVARTESPRARWIVASTVWRGVSAGVLDWMGYPLILLFGFITGGGLSLIPEDLTPLRYLYVPLTSYLMFSTIGPRLARMHHLDPLPLARRLLFPVLVVPHFLVFLGGYGLGAVGADQAARRDDLVAYTEIRGSWRVVVAQRFVEVAWDGKVPEAVSPWGESHAPASSSPPWKGSRALVYSPYSTPAGSSREFVAWQLSRAIEAAYGEHISPVELADRYLVTREDGVVVAKGAGTSLRRDYPGLRPVGMGPLFPALSILVCLPWLLFVALLLSLYRPGVSDRVRQALVWTGVGAVLIVFFAIAAAIMADLMETWLLQGVVETPVRWLGGSLPATLATWGAGALLLGAAYRLAQSRFVRMEVPTRPTKFTLLELAREED